jgi:hypothetical protein
VPKFRHKIVAVAGDCSMAGLGLSLNDRQMLVSNVGVIFHAAATIKFDERLKLAVDINVHGTRDVLELAKQMTILKVKFHLHKFSILLIHLNISLNLVIHSCIDGLFKLPFRNSGREILRLSDHI